MSGNRVATVKEWLVALAVVVILLASALFADPADAAYKESDKPMDVLTLVTLAFLPSCGHVHNVFGCTIHDPGVDRSNFAVGNTGHYVESVNGRVTLHITYPLEVTS